MSRTRSERRRTKSKRNWHSRQRRRQHRKLFLFVDVTAPRAFVRLTLARPNSSSNPNFSSNWSDQSKRRRRRLQTKRNLTRRRAVAGRDSVLKLERHNYSSEVSALVKNPRWAVTLHRESQLRSSANCQNEVRIPSAAANLDPQIPKPKINPAPFASRSGRSAVMFWGVVLFRAPRAVFCAKFRIGPKPQNFHSPLPLPARGFPVRSNEAFPYLLTALSLCASLLCVNRGDAFQCAASGERRCTCKRF